MIKAKASIKWIDIKLKLKKEWKKTNADKKEKTESNIVEFPRPDRSFPKGSGDGV